MHKFNEAPINMNCPIVIFYEMHNNPVTSNAIYKLLPTFKKYGYKEFAIESDKNVLLRNLVNHFKERVKDLDKKIKVINEALKLENEQINDEALEVIYKELRPSIKLETYNQKTQFILDSKSYYLNKANALNSKVKLLKSIKKHDIKFSPVGPDGRDPKDQDLYENVKELCLKHKNPIIAYFGISHYNVGKLLHSENKDVHEYYIAVTDTTLTSGTVNHKEAEVRTHKVVHNINIIDIYENPELNPVQLIKDSLYNIHSDEL